MNVAHMSRLQTQMQLSPTISLRSTLFVKSLLCIRVLWAEVVANLEEIAANSFLPSTCIKVAWSLVGLGKNPSIQLCLSDLPSEIQVEPMAKQGPRESFNTHPLANIFRWPRSQLSAQGSLTMKSKAAQWKPGKNLKELRFNLAGWKGGKHWKNPGVFFFFGEVVVKEIHGTAVNSIFNDLPVTSLEAVVSPHPPVLVVAFAAPMAERGSKRSHWIGEAWTKNVYSDCWGQSIYIYIYVLILESSSFHLQLKS